MRATILQFFYRLFDFLFRNARNKLFINVMEVTSKTTVLDVGGTPEFWRKMPVTPQVTLLNVSNAPRDCEFAYVRGSACKLPFADKSFDIVFSNSMIEHLGSWDNQVEAAKEMARVGRRLWVQTPDRSFPIDPHLLTPFFHWLSISNQKRFFRYTLFGLLRRPSLVQAENLINELRLLNIGDVRYLFPHCIIKTEAVAGLTKSIIAISGPQPIQPIGQFLRLSSD